MKRNKRREGTEGSLNHELRGRGRGGGRGGRGRGRGNRAEIKINRMKKSAKVK